MQYCGPRGIPLSTFLEWPQESQDAALAWAAHEARRCPGCGTHPEDWADRAVPQHWHQEVCLGCAAKQKAQAAAAADNDATRGLHTVAADGPAHTCPACNTEP